MQDNYDGMFVQDNYEDCLGKGFLLRALHREVEHVRYEGSVPRGVEMFIDNADAFQDLFIFAV